MIHAEPCCQRLQLAVPIGDTDGADMIAFSEQQFEDGSAIPVEPLRARVYFHTFFDSGHTCWQKLVDPLHLNQTKATRTHLRQAFQATHRGDENACLLCRFQDRLGFASADITPIDNQCFHPYRHDFTSCVTASNWQCPAGQAWSTICARYSSLKYRIVLRTGLGAPCPNPHRLVYFTVSHRSWSSSISPMLARPCTMRESSS